MIPAFAVGRAQEMREDYALAPAAAAVVVMAVPRRRETRRADATVDGRGDPRTRAAAAVSGESPGGRPW